MSIITPREELREALLEAAECCFQRFGYKKTTVEDIAQGVGVCRATVYLYFKSKEEIALAWVERKTQRLCVELEEIARLPETSTDRLRKMLLTRVLFRFDHAQPYTQSLDELLSALRLPLLAQRERYHDMEAKILAEVLTEGATTGEFAVTEAFRTAQLLIVATNSLMPYSLSVRQLGERAEIAATTHELIQMLLSGLSRCGATSS